MRKSTIKKYMRQVLFTPPVEYKEYKSTLSIKLPKAYLLNITFSDILEKRKTIREFSKTRISLNDISTILYYGFGFNIKRKDEDRRHYPSAGGKYPLECYLISRKTKLQGGIYHYNIRDHSLETIYRKVPRPLDGHIPQTAKIKPPLFIIITGVTKRTTQKYGIRGKQYMFIEAGHIGQTIQLSSCALGINAVPMGGGFDDGKIEHLIGVKHSLEPLIYMFALGYAKN